MRRIFMRCLTLFFILISALPVFAAAESINNAQQVTKTPTSIERVIYQEVEAKHNHNWRAIPNYWVKDEQDLMLPFIADKENKDNFIGLFNIKSARIAEIKEVPIDSIKSFIDVEKYLEKYSDIKVFYVGIDYTVNNESMFYYNGVNYRLAVIVPENGQWKLAEMSDAPVASLVTSNISFGSSAEKISEKIHQARDKGLFINPLGKVIKNVAAITVQINGSVVNAPADMDVVEGQAMVPLRWAAEQLGASSVQWDSSTRTIIIKTRQDFYNIEKLASYAGGLQSSADEKDKQIWSLPEKVKNLQLSYAIPKRAWVLNLNRYKAKQLDLPQLPDSIYIRITSDDGLYEHSSATYSAENRQDHYYLPMDWLEYLFNARVNYNDAANVLSIQTPDLNTIKSEIALIENALISANADEAIKLWGRGEQIRCGALQYAALSPQLRQEADKSYYVRRSYWVTGGSSPWVGPITITNRNELSDTKIEYTISFPEITYDPPNTIATEKMVVEKLLYNGREGWFITQILQSSEYGIIDGIYKSNSLYLTEARISLPLPANWTIKHSYPKTIKDEQGRSIGSLEELGGYFLPNHRNVLSDKKMAGGLGESHLLVLLYQSPAASEIQESWQEVHAMIPIKTQHWLDIGIKVSPEDDIVELQKILENATMGATRPQ
ncbi:copper amine oxidase N-terminal domain-containing protein [Desulfoscipio gibsoniae]|uniref:Copper amine oxidase family protein n=1 Tax=Desulfoscipio gibsoniae DSM 7213 TaxID=767817 RepID=R4KH80_9FIRM|nr:copper amine oxidase N-terminal domain-containing protein [Desulfoscipio gibsoniae]AGL02543.1 copper amine oxidase family protein [Desulfoscipio gibsoniae DSM 7213]